MTDVQAEGYRLSPRQRQLWPPTAAGDALRAQAVIRIEGELDAPALGAALAQVAERHQALTTAFPRTPGLPLPVQVVTGARPPVLRRAEAAADGGGLQEILDEEWSRPFDLEKGPVLHALLVPAAAGRHDLVLTLPALLADRITLANLAAEVAACYGARRGGAPPSDPEEIVQYLQFSEWHNEILEDEESEEGRAFWRERQARDRPPVPALALAEPRGPFAPHVLAIPLDPALPAALATLAGELGASVETVLLSAWGLLVWHLAGGGTAAFARVVSGRKYEAMDGSCGLFSAWVPIEVALTPDLPFAEVVRRVGQTTRETADWQEYFLPNERDAVAALCGFEWVAAPEPVTAGGLAFAHRQSRSHLDPFAVQLVARSEDGGFVLELAVDASRMDERVAAFFAGRVERLLAAAVAAPRGAIGDLAFLPEAEERWLVDDLNVVRSEVAFRTVHHLFEEQVRRTPDAPAVHAGTETVSFAQLDRRADRLARRLRALGVGPEVAVALFLRRSPEALVAILATLKAGGAYVPLDPASPAERLRFQLADSRARVVLTERPLADRLPEAPDLPVVFLDAEAAGDDGAHGAEPSDSFDLSDPAADPSPRQLAYILYTSGSTGRPKGVMVAHGELVHYLSWAIGAYGLAAGAGSLVHSPLTFDLTVTTLLGPLLAGRPVTLLPEEAGLDELLAALAAGEHGVVKLTPTHLLLLGRELAGLPSAPRLAALVVGGEALSAEGLTAWRRRLPGTRIFNEYGPTETVVGCSVHAVGEASPARGPVPIGRPIAGARLYLLDERLRPVPLGLPGELFIGGDGVARGYVGRPDLTAERFLPDPFAAAQAGARMYRSGDLARHLPDGELDYLGRIDRQVKVRGYRVELGEIEAVLRRDPRLAEVVVLLREDAPADPRLVAYLVAAGEAVPSFEELRTAVGAQLPDYMVPASFVPLAALPLTANGKLDRAALPLPGSERPELERAYVAPRDALEEVLAAVWADSLGIDRVGILDNYFVLGGDSMRSVRLVARAKDRGLVFTVQDLFRLPTVSALAELLRERVGLPAPAAAGVEESAAEAADELAIVEQLENLSEEEIRALLKSSGLTAETEG